jgi:hypothetical protein
MIKKTRSKVKYFVKSTIITMALEMFDYIFMNPYNSDFESASPSAGKAGGTNESYKDKLKTLIFSPGKPIKGIPVIGGKTQIFTANMRQYYIKS